MFFFLNQQNLYIIFTKILHGENSSSQSHVISHLVINCSCIFVFKLLCTAMYEAIGSSYICTYIYCSSVKKIVILPRFTETLHNRWDWHFVNWPPRYRTINEVLQPETGHPARGDTAVTTAQTTSHVLEIQTTLCQLPLDWYIFVHLSKVHKKTKLQFLVYQLPKKKKKKKLPPI